MPNRWAFAQTLAAHNRRSVPQPCVHNRMSSDDADNVRAHREDNAERARMEAELQLLLLREARLRRRKLRCKLRRGARAAGAHRTPAVTMIGAPELEEGFEDVDLDDVHDSPEQQSDYSSTSSD
jgi:hypothetical protein